MNALPKALKLHLIGALFIVFPVVTTTVADASDCKFQNSEELISRCR